MVKVGGERIGSLPSIFRVFFGFTKTGESSFEVTWENSPMSVSNLGRECNICWLNWVLAFGEAMQMQVAQKCRLKVLKKASRT